MEEWVSLRAYARHRKVALSAVQKAIEAKRVTAVRRRPSGRLHKIEKHQADAQWMANTDPVEAARNGKLGGPAAVLEQQPNSTSAPVTAARPGAPGADDPPAGGAADAPEGTSGAKDDQGEYLAARAKREGFLAQQAELDTHERIALLAPWDRVDRKFTEVFLELKSAVFLIADRKAQILAAETDPVRAHRLLVDEFRTVFDECSRRFAHRAAGVAGDS